MEIEKNEEIARHYMLLGKYEKALAEVDKLLSKKPQKAYYLYLRAYCLNGLDRFSNALIEIENALKEGLSTKTGNNLMGVIYWNLDNYFEAKKCFEEVLRVDPNNGEVLAKYGYMEYKLNSKTECGEIMKNAMRIAPNNTTVLHVIFNYYREKNDKEALKDVLEKYLACSGSEIDKLQKLGDYELTLKHYKKAKEYYKQAFLLDPTKKYLYKKMTLIDLKFFTLGLPVNKIVKYYGHVFFALIVIVIVLDSFRLHGYDSKFSAVPVASVLFGIFIIVKLLLAFYIQTYNKIYKLVMKRRGLDE